MYINRIHCEKIEVKNGNISICLITCRIEHIWLNRFVSRKSHSYRCHVIQLTGIVGLNVNRKTYYLSHLFIFLYGIIRYEGDQFLRTISTILCVVQRRIFPVSNFRSFYWKDFQTTSFILTFDAQFRSLNCEIF